jgi:hypothetical protein
MSTVSPSKDFLYLMNKYRLNGNELQLLLDLFVDITRSTPLVPLSERPLEPSGAEVVFFSPRDTSQYLVRFKGLRVEDWYGTIAEESNGPINDPGRLGGHSEGKATPAILCYRNGLLVFVRTAKQANCRKLLGKIQELESGGTVKPQVKAKEMVTAA